MTLKLFSILVAPLLIAIAASVVFMIITAHRVELDDFRVKLGLLKLHPELPAWAPFAWMAAVLVFSGLVMWLTFLLHRYETRGMA